MKIDPGEIEFDCPQCKRPMTGDKALLGEMINCPDCNEPFVPIPRKPAPPAPEVVSAFASLNAAQMANLDSQRARDTTSRADKIHSQANFFTAVALLFCCIGLLVAFCSAYASISGDGAGDGFLVAGSIMGASLWFYLVAQIVHIRANTEK